MRTKPGMNHAASLARRISQASARLMPAPGAAPAVPISRVLCAMHRQYTDGREHAAILSRAAVAASRGRCGTVRRCRMREQRAMASGTTERRPVRPDDLFHLTFIGDVAVSP